MVLVWSVRPLPWVNLPFRTVSVEKRFALTADEDVQAHRFRTDVSWSSIPSDILRAELARRQAGNGASEKPACGSGDRGAYDTPLHVFALLLILSLSTLGMSRGRRV